jgi:hypothetical protein
MSSEEPRRAAGADGEDAPDWIGGCTQGFVPIPAGQRSSYLLGMALVLALALAVLALYGLLSLVL